MIHSHWYFCSCIKLSPDDTASYLSILHTLENCVPAAQQLSALNQLEQLDALQRTYALPILVDLLLSDRLRQFRYKQGDIPEVHRLVKKCKELITGLFSCENESADQNESLSRTSQCPVLVYTLDKEPIESVPGQVFESLKTYNVHRTQTSNSYFETDEFCREIFWLSLLCTAGRKVPQSLTGLDFDALLEAALFPACGELPLQLALEIQSLSGKPFRELVRKFPKDWLGRPFYVRLTLEQLFCVGKQYSKKEHSLVDALLLESYEFKFFEKYYNINKDMLLASWIDDGLEGRDLHQVCATLWQISAWEIAFDANPTACIDALSFLWGTPSFGRKKPDPEYRYTQKLLLNGTMRIAYNNRVLPIALCSPWQYCKDIHDLDLKTANPFSDFPYLMRHFVALQAFSAATLLHRIFYATQDSKNLKGFITFYRLLLNLGDAFECDGARKEREAPGLSHIWSKNLCGLGIFAWQCIKDIGVGREFPQVPINLIQMLCYPRQTDNVELNKLVGKRGLLTCAHWAVQSLLSDFPQPGQKENQWLADSCAEQLCDKLFSEYFKEAQSSMDALELLTQKCSSLLGIFYFQLESSWIDRYRISLNEDSADEIQLITISDLLLARPVTWTEWQNISHLDKSRFCPEAWSLVQTLRLQAVLRISETQQNKDVINQWVGEWESAMAELNSTDLQNHLLLYVLCNLLCPADLNENEQTPITCANQIFLTAIDTVYSAVSRDTIFYAKLISGYLCQKTTCFPFTDNTLHLAQTANLLKLMELARTENAFQGLLYQFLVGCADSLQQESLNPVRAQMAKYWNSRCVIESSMRAERIANTQWNPLIDRFMLHSGEQLAVARPIQDQAKNFWNDSTTNGFLSIIDQPDSGQKLVGIIAEQKPCKDNNGKYDRYYVNCGNGTLLTATQPSARKYNMFSDMVGQVVIIKSGKTDNKYTIQTPAWMPGPPDEIVKVKITSLTRNTRNISITFQLPNRQTVTIPECNASGSNIDQQDRMSVLLDFWCPDIPRFYREGERIFSSSTSYEASYDRDLNAYVPAARSFVRLLLERILVPDNPSRTISLIYIYTKDEQRGEDSLYLFSAAPGVNYLLSDRDWLPGCLNQMIETLPQGMLTVGLQINARLIFQDSQPYLIPDSEQPWDDRNYRWATMFKENMPIYLEYQSTSHEHFVTCHFGEEKIKINAVLQSDRYRQAGCNAQLITNGWNPIQQRTGVILCEPMKEQYIYDNFYQLETVQQIIGLKEGDVTRIHHLCGWNSNKGYYEVMLENGLRANCAAESLSMLQTMNQAFYEGRISIVENIFPRDKNAGAHISEEHPDFSNAPTFSLPEASQQVNIICGIVSRFTPVPRDKTADNVCQEVWFVDGERLFKHSIPVPAFHTPPRMLGAIVTAYRQKDGLWVFEASDRELYIRALWQIKDHTREKSTSIYGNVLDRDVRVPGHGYCIVSQDCQQPVLHIWSNATNLPKEPFCGLSSENGVVIRYGNRFCSPAVFSYAKYTDIVSLNQNGARLWGESGRNDFFCPSRTWSVNLIVESPKTMKLQDYYDIRRVFRQEAGATVQSKPDQQQIRMQSIVDTYKDWLQDPVFPFHITGIIQDNKLKLNSLKVPELYDHDTIIDKWTEQVPFVAGGERTWVDTNPQYPYPRIVRAVLRPINNVWYASCKDASPFLLDSKLVGELGMEPIKQPLYYAGPEDNDHIRFEWGCGYCFLARREDIVDPYGNSIGMEFFYGDRIKESQLVQGKGEYGWQLLIPVDAVRHEIAWQLWCDAQQNILQLLNVYIDRPAGNVEIIDISMAGYNNNGGMDSSNGWGFGKFRHSVLDHESVEKLLEEKGPETEDRIILASLDLSVSKEKLRGLRYHYISLENAEKNPELIAGKTICMVAGSIVPSRTYPRQGRRNVFTPPVNDYILKFYLPDRLSELTGEDDFEQGKQFTVTVIRRSFSLDESKLRVLYQDDRANEYHGFKMLVHLFDHKRNRKYEWNGSVLDTLSRPKTRLLEWVKNKNGCLVVLDDPDKSTDTVRLEIAPGITCKLECSAVSGTIRRGATAHLRQKDGDILQAEISLPSDTHYIPSNGRPVELLPMDGVIRRYYEWDRKWHNTESADMLEELSEILADEKSHFTVASFPQILLSNSKALERMICTQPPRLSYLQPDRYGEQNYSLNENAQFTAARLRIDPVTNQPELCYIHPDMSDRRTEWSRISFMDDTPERIKAFMDQGRWHYHDKETAVYDAEKRTWKKCSLPNGNYQQMIFFPTSGGELRLKPKHLGQYGYSPREIAEHGLPAHNSFYPIAYADNNCMWIELMPGRIIELPKSYLFHSANTKSLESLYCQTFHPGDMVCLEEGESYYGGLRQILLSDFRLGIRASFGSKRNYLPVMETCSGTAVRLGCERRSLVYPAADPDRLAGKTLAYIDGDNRLAPYDGRRPFAPGDTVMLGLDMRGNLCVPGYTNSLYVYLSNNKNQWVNAIWIYKLLQNWQGRKNFFDATSSLLTAKVIQYEQKREGQSTLTVAICQSDLDILPVGTILCAICLGLLTEAQEPVVLMQSGDTIFRMDPESLLLGVPKDSIIHVVQSLAESRQGIWLHKEEDGWRNGLARCVRTDAQEISLTLCVEKAKGILCCTAEELELHWLSADKASRAAGVSILSLWDALGQHKRRSAQLMPDQSFSLVDTWESKQRFSTLKFAPAKYRAVPHSLIKTFENGKSRYLAELFPMGDLVYLDSEEPLPKYDGKYISDPIPVELTTRYDNIVTVVPFGTLRIHQRLPRWINSALNNALSDGRMNVNLFRKGIPPYYEFLCAQVRKGNSDVVKDIINEDFLRSDRSVNAKLCYLCSLVKGSKGGRMLSDDKMSLAMEYAEQVLLRWLDEQGIYLASGFDSKYLEKKQNKWNIDLLPALSGILLLAKLKDHNNSNVEIVAKELSVHMTRMVGVACESSVHVEVLLKKWLQIPEQRGFWKRLSNLSLGGVELLGEPNELYSGYLSPEQYKMLKKVCSDIRHMNLPEGNDDLKLVVDCLLYSIGELTDFSLFSEKFHMEKKDYFMNRLAVLGHTLTPPASNGRFAMSKLTSAMEKTLNDIRVELSSPLAILTDKPLPLSESERIAIVRRCQDFMQELRS